ncbi:MAG: hypothetical protein FWE62_01885 [Firmicutes bacterium]|nr:hypothetical protein [Bacillota bacterium]
MDQKIVNSFRVGGLNWLDGKRFAKLLDLFDKYRGITQQITLFTTENFAPVALCKIEERAGILAERIRAAKARGYSCGINVTATVGHHSEDWDDTLQGPYFRMTNAQGRAEPGSFCLNDESFVSEYVEPLYKLLAETKPDCIWVDDDVRHTHMGVTCFCACCVNKFNAENACSHTRESLAAALNAFDVELRRKWLRFQSDGIRRLLNTIRRTVHAVSPDIILGFMSGERYYEGYDFEGWADALSDNGKYPVYWRPGGGFYWDDNLSEMLAKADTVGRQVAYLPDSVVSVQSEIENCPCQPPQKSPKTTALEAALYIAKGCNATAFNILPSFKSDSFKHFEPHFKAILRYTPFYGLLIDTLKNAKLCGIHSGWHPHNQAIVGNPEWLKHYTNGEIYSKHAAEIFSLGFSETYRPENAAVRILSGNAPLLLSEQEIKKTLSGGVYLDAGAVRALTEMGYGQYVGFSTGEENVLGAMEKYLPHQINEGIVGQIRYVPRLIVWGDSRALVPSAGATALAEVADIRGRRLAPCAMGVYRNSLGGRICAAGYMPFNGVRFMHKALQMKRIFRFLSDDTLPAYTESYCRLLNHTYVSADGKISAVLLNNSLDALKNTDFFVRTEAERLSFYTMDCQKTTLQRRGTDGKYGRFRIPKIHSWEMAFLTEVER